MSYTLNHVLKYSQFLNVNFSYRIPNNQMAICFNQLCRKVLVDLVQSFRLDRSDVSLPSHSWTNGWQPLKNIVTNGWLTENHWKTIDFLQWLYFLPLGLAEADIKQTNVSFWKIENIFLQWLEQDVPWFMSTCVLVYFMPYWVSDKSSLMRILSQISFFVKNA